MPPEDEGTPLTADQIRVLRQWIDEGAEAPSDELAEVDARQHWAFQSLRRPQVPVVPDAGWVRNPLDAFIAARHRRLQLQPAQSASQPVLLRRLYVDLTGLPPTRRQLHEFLADDSPRAYENVVDRLLDSPQYAERWARHWMDVWRYSDWYGRRSRNDVRNSYPHVWRWRDWIIRSLAADKGYDQMVREMLAADELAPEDDDTIVATGYLVRSWYKLNYNTWMKDLVEHTGKAFLGLTLNCAMCHDHKYDPITQEEYFKFRAFFEPLELRQDRVPGLPDPGPYTGYVYGSSMKPIEAGLARVFDKNLDAETRMFVLGDERNRFPGKPPVTPGPPASLLGETQFVVNPIQLPTVAYYPGAKSFIRQESLSEATQAVAAASAKLAGVSPSDRDLSALGAHELSTAQANLRAVRARLEADLARFGQESEDEVRRRAGVASRAEREARLKLAEAEWLGAQQALAKAREAKQKGQQNPSDDEAAKAVASAEKAVANKQQAMTKARHALNKTSTDYAPFGPSYARTSTGRRSSLARWIGSEHNPLTARVAVNHLWLRHFGSALVPTVFDFGRNGKPPSHPQLLDWLAVEFMENAWSMKHVHRLIVTSGAYRMSSSAGESGSENSTVDPQNRYLWRMNSRRMESEVIRDALLALSGGLDLTIGGEELQNKLGETSRRRSVYYAHHDEGRVRFLQMFNAADPCDCYQRTETIVPQQALAMTNSRLARDCSRRLAKRLSATSGSPDDFISSAFETILSRAATDAENAACHRFLPNQIALYSGADFNSSQHEDQAVPAAAAPQERARESLVHVLLNHNDFVTVR